MYMYSYFETEKKKVGESNRRRRIPWLGEGDDKAVAFGEVVAAPATPSIFLFLLIQTNTNQPP